MIHQGPDASAFGSVFGTTELVKCLIADDALQPEFLKPANKLRYMIAIEGSLPIEKIDRDCSWFPRRWTGKAIIGRINQLRPIWIALKMNQPTMNTTNKHARSSYRVAYILCFLAGWMGVHRLYLRRWGTAFLYMLFCGLAVATWTSQHVVLSSVILALLAFYWLFDLLILPLLVWQRRDIEAGIPLPPEQATWAKDEKRSLWNRLQVVIRMCILVFAPAITIVIATSLRREMDERTVDEHKGTITQFRAWMEGLLDDPSAQVVILGDSTA